VKKKPPQLPKCRSEEECEAIRRGLKDAYAKGRRYRRIGFKRGERDGQPQ
jgi:hypothetical protein